MVGLFRVMMCALNVPRSVTTVAYPYPLPGTPVVLTGAGVGLILGAIEGLDVGEGEGDNCSAGEGLGDSVGSIVGGGLVWVSGMTFGWSMVWVPMKKVVPMIINPRRMIGN